MYLRVLFVILMAVSLVGCATASKGKLNETQQLHNRIQYLETELERKNQEISTLENQLTSAQDSSSDSRKQKGTETPKLSVRQIQRALKNAGFYKGTIDGQMGSKTKEAIKDFQRANGLKADGIAGKKTTVELRRYLTK